MNIFDLLQTQQTPYRLPTKADMLRAAGASESDILRAEDEARAGLDMYHSKGRDSTGLAYAPGETGFMFDPELNRRLSFNEVTGDMLMGGLDAASLASGVGEIPALARLGAQGIGTAARGVRSGAGGVLDALGGGETAGQFMQQAGRQRGAISLGAGKKAAALKAESLGATKAADLTRGDAGAVAASYNAVPEALPSLEEARAAAQQAVAGSKVRAQELAPKLLNKRSKEISAADALENMRRNDTLPSSSGVTDSPVVNQARFGNNIPDVYSYPEGASSQFPPFQSTIAADRRILEDEIYRNSARAQNNVNAAADAAATSVLDSLPTGAFDNLTPIGPAPQASFASRAGDWAWQNPGRAAAAGLAGVSLGNQFDRLGQVIANPVEGRPYTTSLEKLAAELQSNVKSEQPAPGNRAPLPSPATTPAVANQANRDGQPVIDTNPDSDPSYDVRPQDQAPERDLLTGPSSFEQFDTGPYAAALSAQQPAAQRSEVAPSGIQKTLDMLAGKTKAADAIKSEKPAKESMFQNIMRRIAVGGLAYSGKLDPQTVLDSKHINERRQAQRAQEAMQLTPEEAFQVELAKHQLNQDSGFQDWLKRYMLTQSDEAAQWNTRNDKTHKQAIELANINADNRFAAQPDRLPPEVKFLAENYAKGIPLSPEGQALLAKWAIQYDPKALEQLRGGKESTIDLVRALMDIKNGTAGESSINPAAARTLNTSSIRK